MILAKDLKAIFCDIPDERWVDLWLVDGSGVGPGIESITLGSELGVNVSVNVMLPDGYYLTTTPPN